MKIFIVEDNKNLADSLKMALTEDGYAVDVANDGDTALRYLSTQSKICDLVILDIMLPRKSGLDVCRQLRFNKITIPILMLTAKDTIEDKIKGLDSGADDYLVKPFALEEFLARVRALLRRPKETIQMVLTVGMLRLNNQTKEVTVMGRHVSLTAREFSILECLMRHPNQVFTRDQIFSHVWESSPEDLTNVIDAHVKNLRKKLGNYGTCIKTLRGMGYRLTV